jgi:peptidoglycan hydrolase CwlO-like protein
VTDPGSNLHAINLLKRLKKEYPASRWTVQSGQLTELLSGVEDLRRQIKSLKSQNQNLGSEVNELNRNIEKLKQLDQELEKKRR